MARNPRRFQDPVERAPESGRPELVDPVDRNLNFEEVKVTFETPADIVDAALTDLAPEPEGWITLDSVSYDAPAMHEPDEGLGLDG